LPDANDFLDASTVFFRHSHGGKAVSQPLHLPTRAHAETVYLLSQHSIHGSLSLPTSENVAQALKQQIAKRLESVAAKAGELARSRTGDEKRAADLARLLEFWMTHGKPRREPKATEAQEP